MAERTQRRNFDGLVLSIWAPLQIVCAIALLAGCTNQQLALTLGSGDGVTSSSPTPGNGATAGATEAGYFNLQRAIPTQSNPTGSIDVVGDQQGTIGKFCQAAAGAAGSGQNTGCQCQFSYTNHGRTESLETTPSYTETDLLRCPIAGLPADVTDVTIKIRLLAISSYSSELPIDDAGMFGGQVDLSSTNQYLRVRRFQCRDHVYVPHMFDGTVYDPFQSESTRLSYPLNFYTSNYGSTFKAMIYGASQGMSAFLANWQCAINPYTQESWENRWVFSQAPLNGSLVIENSRGTPTERSLYYLSKRSVGKFNVPVRAWIAPGIVSQAPDPTSPTAANYPILGYAARPNADESCPVADVAIPAGYRWRKLWQFRASLTPRRFVASTTSIAAVKEIACNPGSWDEVMLQVAAADKRVTCTDGGLATTDAITGSTFSSAERAKCLVFKDCGYGISDAVWCQTDGDDPGWASCRSLKERTTDILTARVISGKAPKSACFALETPDSISTVGAAGAAPAMTGISPGTDGLTRLSSRNTDINLDLDAGFSTASSGYLADLSNKLALRNYDDGISRYDYLYVVSPPELRCSDFNRGGGASSAAQPYFPYTFRRLEDCNSSNPTSDSTCASQLENRNTFLLFSKEAGDAQPSGEGCGTAYPLCVVQPIDLGAGT